MNVSTLTQATSCARPHNLIWTHCNSLQHIATHCTTLHRIAPHCNTLQHTATHCNILQCTITHCTTLQHTTHTGNELRTVLGGLHDFLHTYLLYMHMRTWTYTCVNTRTHRHTDTHTRNELCMTLRGLWVCMQHIATNCNTLHKHITLQRIATGNELRKALRGLGVWISKLEMKSLMLRFDRNHDGVRTTHMNQSRI